MDRGRCTKLKRTLNFFGKSHVSKLWCAVYTVKVGETGTCLQILGLCPTNHRLMPLGLLKSFFNQEIAILWPFTIF